MSTAKQAAARAAYQWLLERKPQERVVGVGSGSTVTRFIEQLQAAELRECCFVAATKANAAALRQRGLLVEDPNSVTSIDYYFDGADEINSRMEMIKGGGAALTGEKILASMAKQFICLADSSKQVPRLGEFPLPVEVIPMARSLVARQLAQLGGNPEYRVGTSTEHGNVILDVYNLALDVPAQWERKLNSIAGVVENGIFAQHRATMLVVGADDGSARWLDANSST